MHGRRDGAYWNAEVVLRNLERLLCVAMSIVLEREDITRMDESCFGEGLYAY